VAAHSSSSSSSHLGRKQTNHSSHTAAAASYIITNSAMQRLTETSATIDGLCEDPIYGDAVSAAAVLSFIRSVALNSSSLNDMLRVANVMQ